MRVKIEKLDHFGRGITKIDNKICFVEGALTDEVVDAEIVREKSKYLEGKTTKVIDSSKYRKRSTCSRHLKTSERKIKRIMRFMLQ